MRFGRRADVDSWLESVAHVLPLPHQAELPYTIGDAASEYGTWARAVRSERWNGRSEGQTRDSLRTELRSQVNRLGRRLTSRFVTAVETLCAARSQTEVIAAADTFTALWSDKATITEAFADLCDAAQQPSATTQSLRNHSDVLAARIGPAARGGLSILDAAAAFLIEPEDELAEQQSAPLPQPLDEASRVALAERTLLNEPRGEVTVWLIYSHAISAFRVAAGPITFLRADWALQVAFGASPNDFPERRELRAMREDVYWLDELEKASGDAHNRIALVRVGLGERVVAGALGEARRRVEALLSIAVEAGGASWRDAGVNIILVNGSVRGMPHPPRFDQMPDVDDSYGMGATSELISNVVEQLHDALSVRPMPDQLVEALTALRQARMTDHRDIHFSGAQETSPRVATALEDHAMEQLAGALGVGPRDLATALQQTETIALLRRRTARALTAPFERVWADDDHTEHDRIEREISTYDQHGQRTVSVVGVVQRADTIRGLPMTALQRADFEDALRTCTEAEYERTVLDDLWAETCVLRARHRRVRNAVNHGLPLSAPTLHSVRGYAEETSTTALYLALSCFKSNGDGPALVGRETKIWEDRGHRLEAGTNWATEEAQSGSPS